jgi:hypothetical protein
MKNKRRREGEITFVPSSGNVFADLGLPNAEELLARAEREYEMRKRDRGADAALDVEKIDEDG